MIPETTGFVLETGGLGSELIKKATEITEQTSSAAEKAREAQAFGKVSKIGKWAGRIGTAFTILSAAYETVNKLADTHTFVNVGLALTFFCNRLDCGAKSCVIRSSIRYWNCSVNSI
jgi:hypothetical protein